MVAASRDLKSELCERRGDANLTAASDSLRADLNQDLSSDEALDALAQAVVCAGPILDRSKHAAALDCLRESARPWEQWALRAATARSSRTQYSVLSSECKVDPAHLYDEFLHRYAPPIRKHHGVFFTPQPIADYIVAQIDGRLRDDFGLSEGLASHSAFCSPQSALDFLDPACGTGVFLLAVIDYLHTRLGNCWNEFIPDLLLRLTGIELLPAAAFLAKLNIACKLAETGYDFRETCPINIHIGDALGPTLNSAIRNPQSTIPVLLGNPPFSSLTTNTNPWIARLVRGDDDVRGYAQAGDQLLGERKTWLHDDYVKFLRLAQWHVEQAGRGIVGFVTNHGYLDNATFRLLRQELLRVFPHIQIVDLHGNRKNGEAAPNGSRDENVFGLDQGVAIGILSRSDGDGAPRVEYAELWGTREEKLASLGKPPSLARRVSVTPPHWRFIPATICIHPEYEAGWSLSDAMPVNTTAPVTARDHFVVGFTPEELCERIAELRDFSIPVDEIRRRYFSRTRSRRYTSGDTRGWKLAEARRAIAADADWQTKIVRCLYRPFDWRYVFWHAAMIDWPRTDVTRHLLPPIPNPKSKIQNLCLLARRQQLPTQPCTYFWVSDGLALDGVIRSDNRGSESLFPLFLHADGGRPNFAAEFIADVEQRIGQPPLAEDLLAYIYALFHSPTYRERFAHELRGDFPRVLLPASGPLFGELVAMGKQLIDLHLLRDGVGSLWQPAIVDHGQTSPARNSRPPVEDFRVGGYEVLKKWLQPKWRSANDPQYVAIASAIAQTQNCMASIDEDIERAGGFPAAFQPKPRPGVGVFSSSTSMEQTP